MFKYEIDDKVYFIYGKRIHVGDIISRKLVESPYFQNPPAVPGSSYNLFDVFGNKFGRPGERYEIKIDNIPRTITLGVEDLYITAKEVAMDLMCNIGLEKNNENL